MRSRVAWSAAPIDDTRSMFFSGPVPSRHGRGQNLLLKRNYTSSVQEWSRKSPEFLLVNQPQRARSCKTYISGETQHRRDHGARSVLTDTRPYGCVCFLYIYLRSLQWPIFLNFYLTWARMCHVCIRVSLTPTRHHCFFFLSRDWTTSVSNGGYMHISKNSVIRLWSKRWVFLPFLVAVNVKIS